VTVVVFVVAFLPDELERCDPHLEWRWVEQYCVSDSESFAQVGVLTAQTERT